MSGKALVEGKLEVHVFEGRNLPNRHRFGKQDSIVELSIGTTKKRTQEDKKGGSNPRWSDRVHFNISGVGKSQILVKALEIDGPNKFDDIGSCVVDLSKIFEEEEVDGWYGLKHKEKPAGDIYIEFTFTPKGGRKKLSKPDELEEEEEETNAFIPVAPKINSSSATIASAPSNFPDMTSGKNNTHRPQSIQPHSNTARPGACYTDNSSASSLRPSMADLRPYSSASMYRPDLAAQYANKHGKKPLPLTPPTGAPVLPSTNTHHPAVVVPTTQMQSPNQQINTTMVPGQFSTGYVPTPNYPHPPHQFGSENPLPYNEGGQQPQNQQQPLMALFIPPGGDVPQPPKSLPQPPVQAPAFNSAYNQVPSRPPPPTKQLPNPPVEPGGSTGNNSGMVQMHANDHIVGMYPTPHQSPNNIQQMQPINPMIVNASAMSVPYNNAIPNGSVLMGYPQFPVAESFTVTPLTQQPQIYNPGGFTFEQHPTFGGMANNQIPPRQLQQQQQQQQQQLFASQDMQSQMISQQQIPSEQQAPELPYNPQYNPQYNLQLSELPTIPNHPPGYGPEMAAEPSAPPMAPYNESMGR